jgi:hypothetical protein
VRCTFEHVLNIGSESSQLLWKLYLTHDLKYSSKKGIIFPEAKDHRIRLLKRAIKTSGQFVPELLDLTEDTEGME